MKYVLGELRCQKCGSARIAPVSDTTLKCENCADGMHFQPRRPRVGEVLRRWTADASSSTGRQVRARAAFEDPLVADVRRLRLAAVVSKLEAVKVGRAG
jgi:hypothetical protein